MSLGFVSCVSSVIRSLFNFMYISNRTFYPLISLLSESHGISFFETMESNATESNYFSFSKQKDNKDKKEKRQKIHYRQKRQDIQKKYTEKTIKIER